MTYRAATAFSGVFSPPASSDGIVRTPKPGSSSHVVQLKHLIEAKMEELTKVHAVVMTKREAVKAALKEIEKKKKTSMEGRTAQTRKRKRETRVHDSKLILSQKLRSGSRVMPP
jgi:septum formation inhibitor MinC